VGNEISGKGIHDQGREFHGAAERLEGFVNIHHIEILDVDVLGRQGLKIMEIRSYISHLEDIF
jgi:hypothetical protein